MEKEKKPSSIGFIVIIIIVALAVAGYLIFSDDESEKICGGYLIHTGYLPGVTYKIENSDSKVLKVKKGNYYHERNSDSTGATILNICVTGKKQGKGDVLVNFYGENVFKPIEVYHFEVDGNLDVILEETE